MKKSSKLKAKYVSKPFFHDPAHVTICPDCATVVPVAHHANVNKVVRCLRCREAHKSLMQIIRRESLKKKKR